MTRDFELIPSSMTPYFLPLDGIGFLSYIPPSPPWKGDFTYFVSCITNRLNRN